MDAFLGKITQHAMNYAIRSGIGITASFAISQSSRLLKTVDNNADYQELHTLQERLDSKIRIISPAIDLVELISARGNTTLESAVTLTKALRWDIQSLGVRLSKAAAAEESSKRNKTKASSRAAHEMEIRRIILDIKKLLTRIEDAVPLINLAITTSGASLSTTLPASVSPSRMLQASTFLTAGDTQYAMSSGGSIQVGPSFTLSLYMLFTGHINRVHLDTESMRDTTWKEVMHKARVRLVRIPLDLDFVGLANGATGETLLDTPAMPSIEESSRYATISGDGKATEFAYRIEIIEDLDDDRVHSFEDGEPQPGPYGDVQLAGIREFLPIHQISKIFYADTGKILNIGNQGEANSPVLLLKRDVNALPPRRMMQDQENTDERRGYSEDVEGLEDVSQDDIDQQICRESSVHLAEETSEESSPTPPSAWQLPLDLDPEWLALEVYTEPEESPSEDDLDINDDSAYTSHRPSSSSEAQTETLASNLASLNLSPQSSPPPTQVTSTASLPMPDFSRTASPFGPIRSSLSLLEMLVRLTALQQFQQASHLSIPDELLTFFLEESSTTGAGGDGDQRRRVRRDARRKVGFDPYDESPIKRHGEDYQYQYPNQSEDYERGGTPYQRGGTPGTLNEYGNQDGYGFEREYSSRSTRETPQRSPGSWLLRSREGSVPHGQSPGPSSPIQPLRQPARRPTRPLERVMLERGAGKNGSPLGRDVSVETDSTLGTSPGSPTLVNREKGEVGSKK